MRRMSIGTKRQSVDASGPLNEVLLRTRNPPAAPPGIGPGFMRRSCTFVTEGSWRKSSFGMGGGQKETKDKVNLALKVRQKASQLGGNQGEDEEEDYLGDLREGGRPGKVSRFVGNLRSWSSSEDVRQSVVGAFARTVNNIKQRPVSKKVKQVLSRTNSSNPDQPPSSTKLPNNRTNTKIKPVAQTKVDSKSTRFSPSSKSTPQKNPTRKVAESKTKTPQTTPQSKEPLSKKAPSAQNKRWLKNLHEGQASHDAKDRKGGPGSRIIPDAEENVPADPLRDVEDVEEGDNADGGDSLSRQESQLQTEATSQNSMAPPANSQSPPSPESLLSKRTELLRRKDHKIREELQIKQDLIAQILNIPKQHFESVADMAGEMGLSNKEPRELVLGAIYQAKKLQEALNDAQSVKECDIMSAQASNDSSRASSLPLYPAPMDKLISISGNLTQLLNALLSLVSERDDERDRMRKELVASRERLHQLHMQQNKVDPPETGASASRTDTTSPHSSRPSSFVSVGSSAADHSEAVPDHPNNQDGDGDESRIIPFSQNVSSEGNLSKCYDTSDCDTGLSQTSISEESEILRVPAPAEPSPPSLPEDAGST